ncbi:hypothetical protein SAMN04515695_2271 [Pseudovibrio sp. Tun.PSC04-5.I4]|nr:hypothetical protein SAMN04515695_2271 [Pseudovibrio sp. Tun.PSC04-5.I4]
MPFEFNRADNSNSTAANHSHARTDIIGDMLKNATACEADASSDLDFLSLFSADIAQSALVLGSIVKHKPSEEMGYVCGETSLICGHRSLKFRTFDSSPTESVTCTPEDLIVIGDPSLKVTYSGNHES